MNHLSDQHKMELLKALREHGNNIKKFADGGSTGLVGALGVGSNFTASGPQQSSQNLQPEIQQQYQQQQDVYGQQQQLANTLQNLSQGQGPNPALAQLNQSTGQNVANQAALMASQRGAGANPGLMARQAAMQGAQIQQNAVGQAASLQAQQQLAAQQALQQQQAQMANQALQGQSILQGATAAQNTANLSAQGLNAQTSLQNSQANQGILGGLMGGAGSVLGSLFAKGGEVKKYAVGGPINDELGIENFSAPSVGMPGSPGGGGGKSPLQSGVSGLMGAGGNALMGALGGGGADVLGDAGSWELGGGLAGGAGDAMGAIGGIGAGVGEALPAIGEGVADVAPLALAAAKGGEIAMPKSRTGQYLKGAAKAVPMKPDARMQFLEQLKSGGKVPGKPKVGGTVNTEKNDTVPALLSAGEIVLPRSVTKSSDPVGNAAKFVEALMKKQGKAPKGKAA